MKILLCHNYYQQRGGEYEVFEACAAKSERADTAGVMLMPGVGFDVVPTDCLANHLKARLPRATSLTLAFKPVGGGSSHGTALTAAEIALGFSMVECRLETGRTHQIRVHLASIGHALVGDPLYNPFQAEQASEEIRQFFEDHRIPFWKMKNMDDLF